MAFTYAGLFNPDAPLVKSATGVLNNLPSLAVSVYVTGTTTLATLYTSRTKGTTAPNPTTTDSSGNLTFFADPGTYDVSYTPTGAVSATVKTVTVGFDPAEPTPGTFGNGTYPLVTDQRIRRDTYLHGFPVANGCWLNGGGPSNGQLQTSTGTTRSVHNTTADCTDLRLAYGNVFDNLASNPNFQTDGINTYSIRAAVEYGGVIYPVTFNGARTGTLDGGGLIISDPVAVEIPAGTKFWVRTYISASGTGWYPNGRSYSNGDGGFAASSDLTAAGSGAIADSSSYFYLPCAILGTPTGRAARSLVIIGDSIAAGQGEGDAGGTGGPYSEWLAGGVQGCGFIGRALGTSLGRINLSVSSRRAAQTVTNHWRAGVLINGCTHALCELGRNDIGANQTLAQVQASLLSIWNYAWRRGVPIWQTTITPQTSSTDGWVTTGNQTVLSAPQEAVRVNLNTWIRAGAPIDPNTLAAVAVGTVGALIVGASNHPLTGYFEVADLAETAQNSGIWKASYTSDGLHPNPTGAAALAPSITPATFTLKP